MGKATIYDYARMCNYYSDRNACTKCPTFSLCGEDYPPSRDTDKMNEIILKWCKEHPVKTRQDKFLEMFPNARMKFGCLNVCPEDIDTSYECLIDSNLCVDCKKSYWLAEVEE